MFVSMLATNSISVGRTPYCVDDGSAMVAPDDPDPYPIHRSTDICI